MVTKNWYFVTFQVARSGGKIASRHKGYLMFRVYILFNIAQLAGGIFHLSFFGGAGHLSILMVIFPLHMWTALLLLEVFFLHFSHKRLFFSFPSFSDFINNFTVTCSILLHRSGDSYVSPNKTLQGWNSLVFVTYFSVGLISPHLILNIPLNQEAVWLQSTGVVMKWPTSRKIFAFQ